MNDEFKIISGSVKKVESELNELNKSYWVSFHGFSQNNEGITIVIHLLAKVFDPPHSRILK